MKLRWIEFQGVKVGFEIQAESEGDQYLLRSLQGLSVQVGGALGAGMPRMLAVCPNLPWENQTSAPSAGA